MEEDGGRSVGGYALNGMPRAAFCGVYAVTWEDLCWWICVVWWKRLSGRVQYCSSICSSDFSFEVYFTIRRVLQGAVWNFGSDRPTT